MDNREIEESPIIGLLEDLQSQHGQVSAIEGEVPSISSDEREDCPRELWRESMVKESKITPRELDVFRGLSVGMHAKEVAAGLGIRGDTVKAHAQSVRKKLSRVLGREIDSTLKMALAYWGITSEELLSESGGQNACRPEPKASNQKLVPR